MAEFINPYNFVPLPPSVVRRRPWWHTGAARHAADGALYSGVLEVEWTLLTPLLIPDGRAGEQMVLSDGRVRLPGSSIKGVVRSLHEAMFNGCLRVFDSDFLPGYRMPAKSPDDVEAKDWTLGLVTKSKDGVPTEIRLGRNVEWVKARPLADLLPRPPRTGDLLEIVGRLDENVRKAPGHHRDQLIPTYARVLKKQNQVVAELKRDGASLTGRLILVTDTKVRKDRPAWWATSELGDERVSIDLQDPLDIEVTKKFQQACDGTDDRRRLSHGIDRGWLAATRFEEVVQSGVTLGLRARQSGLLFAGDVVWVKTRDRGHVLRCEEIQLSQIWRELGSGPAGERVPSDLLPCQNHDNLCFSCATFGSADTTGANRGKGSNSGYASHVRFASATTMGPVTLSRIAKRSPMSSPRPGAGAFYVNRPEPDHVPTLEGDIASHWGSDGDHNSSLRGRKFYWHSDPDAQSTHWQDRGAESARPRYVAAENQPMPTPARIARPGKDAVLRGTITFDRLPWHAVQALLAAIDPTRVPAVARQDFGKRLAVRLGGGRPLGLGSATAQVTGRIMSLADRYGAPRKVPLGDEMTMTALKSILDRVGHVGNVWKRLLQLLDWEGLGPDSHLVSYPPNEDWTQFGTKEFAQSYEFFRANNGLQLANERRRFTPLPPVGQDQVIGRRR